MFFFLQLEVIKYIIIIKLIKNRVSKFKIYKRKKNKKYVYKEKIVNNY